MIDIDLIQTIAANTIDTAILQADEPVLDARFNAMILDLSDTDLDRVATILTDNFNRRIRNAPLLDHLPSLTVEGMREFLDDRIAALTALDDVDDKDIVDVDDDVVPFDPYSI